MAKEVGLIMDDSTVETIKESAVKAWLVGGKVQITLVESGNTKRGRITDLLQHCLRVDSSILVGYKTISSIRFLDDIELLGLCKHQELWKQCRSVIMQLAISNKPYRLWGASLTCAECGSQVMVTKKWFYRL